MDSKQYRTRARALLNQAHDLHQLVAATMTELGDDAGTAEWQMLYSVMNAVGVACEIMNETLHPHPSVFAEVPMVCTLCRNPVRSHRMGNGWLSWSHVDEADDHGSIVRAMVAEGNENVPTDAQIARAEARWAAAEGADD